MLPHDDLLAETRTLIGNISGVARDETHKIRWPYFGGQGKLLLAAVAILLGSTLPWAFILGKLLWASPIALMWTFWAGLVTIAAAVARWRWVVVISSLAGGGTAMFFAAWQTGRILDVCALSFDCMPGPGVGLLLVGGLAALHPAAVLLMRSTKA